MPEIGAPPPPEEELYDGPMPYANGAAQHVRPELPSEPTGNGSRSLFEPVQPPDFEPAPVDRPVAASPAVVGESDAAPSSQYITTLQAFWDVLSARSIALISVLGALAIWGFAVVSPDPMRLYAGAGYSLGVLLPALYLALRKG